jgi:hypothetical protein
MTFKNTILLSVITGLMTVTGTAMADKQLSADEVKALFSGKTFDGHNESNDKDYQVYSDPNGTMIHKNAKRTKEMKWEVTADGQHCALFKTRKCGNIVDKGNGVYYKMNHSNHTHTLKNFVEGNKLN